MVKVHRTQFAARCGVMAVALAMQLSAAPAMAVPDAGQVHEIASVRTVPDSFIVVLKTDPGTRSAAVARDLVNRHGGTIKQTFQRALPGYAVTMTADQARRVAEDPEVAYVEPDRAVSMPKPPIGAARRSEASDVPWGLDRIDQRKPPVDGKYDATRDGSKVTAYILDSGIHSSHQLFQNRVNGGYNATNDKEGTKDCWGRGTGVAGVVGAQTYGVARAVTLVPVRVGGCGADTTTESMIAAVEWIITNSTRPAVVTMGANLGTESTAVNTAISKSIANGLPWVIAIGDNNKTDACATTPGGIAEAITVAATDASDSRWVSAGSSNSGSNHGKCVDLFAPGASVTTLARSSNIGTITWYGTSFAAAHTAGVAAQYLSENPNVTPPQVANALLRMATPSLVQNAGEAPNRLLYSGA